MVVTVLILLFAFSGVHYEMGTSGYRVTEMYGFFFRYYNYKCLS